MSLRKMSPVFALEQRHRLAPEQGLSLWAGTPTALNFISITWRILIMTLNLGGVPNSVLFSCDILCMIRPRCW
jgi:hypothetical protein